VNRLQSPAVTVTRAYLAAPTTCELALALALLCAQSCGRGERSAPARAADPGGEQPAKQASKTFDDPDLPGVAVRGAALIAQLKAALAAKGPEYRPRTRHLLPDGAPRYVNRLIREQSPYLLQHAHNPVDWYPWCDEAFARARAEGKPVLLSIGYSTCHWCHVMEHESFEDETIATFINQHFVAIKVDREERPDLDGVYMTAVQLLIGRGGWPMTLVLTPSREPFFGGTYFPARDGDRGAKRGFLSILRQLADDYASDREQVVGRAREISARVAESARSSTPVGMPSPSLIRSVASQLARSFDPAEGGFGGAPKFPQPALLELLLRHQRRTGDAQSLRMVVTTLEKMAAGGIHDQVGGGFHRYSVDARWLVPHFEKMLYDNAQLANVYLAAYQVTGRDDFAAVARDTLLYLGREMTDAGGGLYAASDADSPAPSGHAEEGLFFTWTPGELQLALGPADAAVAGAYYGVTAGGNFEGRSILHRERSDERVAAELGMPVARLRATLDAARERLYGVRAARAAPARDDKIVASFNGLAISAFARGAFVLGDLELLGRAERAADFALQTLRGSDGRLRRRCVGGHCAGHAFLDDYAFLIAGLLDLFEARADPRWLREALALQAVLDASYADDAHGGYFVTADGDAPPLMREKPSDDGAEPSGNSVELENLLRLHQLTADDRYRVRAELGLAAFGNELLRSPSGHARMLCALDRFLDRPKEILIVAPVSASEASKKSAGPQPLLAALRARYLPNHSVVVAEEGPALDALARLVPGLSGKVALHGRPTAYACEQGRCDLPTSEPAVLAKQLASVEPLGP